MKHFVVAVALAVAATSAGAQEFESGNTLYNKLTGDSTDKLIGMSYVAGIHDAYASLTICAPEGITKGQLADMIRNWLGNNPQQRHLAASVLVNRALSGIWPCKNNRQQSQQNL